MLSDVRDALDLLYGPTAATLPRSVRREAEKTLLTLRRLPAAEAMAICTSLRAVRPKQLAGTDALYEGLERGQHLRWREERPLSHGEQHELHVAAEELQRELHRMWVAAPHV